MRISDWSSDVCSSDLLIERLARALAPEPPLLVRDGGAIAAGYDASLDELRGLRDDSRRLIAELQKRYAQESGVASLKIKHNNDPGAFLEVNPQHDTKISPGARPPPHHPNTPAP